MNKKLALILTVISIALNPISTLAQRPKPPDTGTPSGNTTPGTTRPEAACPETPKPLTAIFANGGKDYTLAEYPTFFFYLPYASEQISSMEFLLLNATQTETIYRTSIQLKDRPGIIKVKLPSNTKNSLAVDNTYYWRFNLDCQPDNTIAPDLVLNGWIKRVATNSEMANELNSTKLKYEVYREGDIWYDAIASLSELYFANPEDKQITNVWNNTLKSLKLDWIIDEPLVDSEISTVQL